MDAPKPTPKPASGISLEPPRPAAPSRSAGPATPGARRPTPETVKVVHEKKTAPKDLPRPGSFRLFVGFLFALLGGLAISYYAGLLGGIADAYYSGPLSVELKSGLTMVYQVEAGGLEALSRPASPAAVAKATEWIKSNQAVVQWAPLVIGFLSLMFAGWCLKKRIGYFIVASLALMIALGALAAAYDWFIPPHCIILPAVGLAYLLQTGQTRTDVTIQGVLGFGFVLVAVAGLTMGLFFLPRWGGNAEVIAQSISKSGPAYLWSQPTVGTSVWMLSASFVEQWTDVVMWGAVLLTASIGAVLCRDKLLRFLSAGMIVTLAILLFKSAHVRWIDFPTLGDNIPPQPHWTYGNVELWQWLALVELAIVAAVLIYKSVGAGGLTVVVAMIWLCCGLHVDTYAGRLTTARFLSPTAAQKISSMPIIPPDGEDGSAADSAPANAVTRRAANPMGGVSPGVIMTREEMASAVAGVAAPVGWFYLTSFLIGIISVGGLRMLIRGTAARTWVMCALWLLFAVLGAAVYWGWPASQKFDVQGIAMTLASHPIHRTLALALTAGGAAFFGTWALRWNSRYHTWLYAAATAVFIGTILSFIALAVMIRWGGFDALPVESYIVLAVGQSALMWVLLLHANFVTPEPARAS